MHYRSDWTGENGTKFEENVRNLNSNGRLLVIKNSVSKQHLFSLDTWNTHTELISFAALICLTKWESILFLVWSNWLNWQSRYAIMPKKYFFWLKAAAKQQQHLQHQKVVADCQVQKRKISQSNSTDSVNENEKSPSAVCTKAKPKFFSLLFHQTFECWCTNKDCTAVPCRLKREKQKQYFHFNG